MVGRTSSAYLKCKHQHLEGKGDYKSIEEDPYGRWNTAKDYKWTKTEEEQRVLYRMADLLVKELLIPPIPDILKIGGFQLFFIFLDLLGPWMVDWGCNEVWWKKVKARVLPLQW